MSGLAKAFFYAGARSMLASQWHVDSGATVKLTRGAFEALKNDLEIGRAEVLRRVLPTTTSTRCCGPPSSSSAKGNWGGSDFPVQDGAVEFFLGFSPAMNWHALQG